MSGDSKGIIENILQATIASESPAKSLDKIVHLVAERFKVDVCSVYIYDPYSNNLILQATIGLNTQSAGAIEMDVHEGLTGLVIETMAPVFVVNPAGHHRYKFYAGSGEEIYKTYLGLPLIYHQKVLGALVVQTLSEDGISEANINTFQTIADQIAATVAYTHLLADRAKAASSDPDKKVLSDSSKKTDSYKEGYLKGEAVSDRVASGAAHYLIENIGFDQIRLKVATDQSKEIIRLKEAFRKATTQIKDIAKVTPGISDQEKAIIEAHLMLLADQSLLKKIIARINEKICAEYALKLVIFEYADVFKSINDPYLSERATDIIDIGHRVLSYLVGSNRESKQAFTQDTIIVSSDISPVDLLAIRQPNLKGIVLAKSGKTSHAVIIAKSLEIPIVICVDGLLDNVRENDYLIVDGVSGFVYINPTKEILDEYARREAETKLAIKQLESLRDLPAVTRDGFVVKLGANLGLLSDIMLAKKYGAEEVGLYRTEFPFLLRKSFPSEKDQVSLYARILDKSECKSITFRTFDVGGDKFLSYIDYPKEDNPFLGWRSIRVSLDLQDVFRTQIRAILRTSALGRLKILFPMITGVEEIREVIKIVNEEKRSLSEKGVAYDENIPLGILIEVPAAVAILDKLMRYVDFFSIGTNDLIQYVLAVDRNNKKVAARYNALHPAVISTVHTIISLCQKHNKPVSICGEAAASPASILLFLGMGADFLSMTPSSIPGTKEFIRSVNTSFCRELLDKVLEMEDSEAVTRFLQPFLTPNHR